MDSKSKKKVTSKISKLDTKSNFIKKNLKVSDSVKQALLAEAKLKKKCLNKKINKGQMRKNSKKLGKVMWIFFFFFCKILFYKWNLDLYLVLNKMCSNYTFCSIQE